MLEKHYFVKKPVEIVSLFTLISRRKDKDFYFAGESHPFWELVYVMQGSVGITADDRVYTLSAGDVIFHKPMEFHRIWSAQGTSPLICIMSFTAEGECMKKLECQTVKTDSYARELIEKAVDYGFSAFEFRGIEGFVIDGVKNNENALAFVNLLELFLCHCAEKGENLVAESDRDAVLFETAVTKLRENIGDKMTVEQLAESCFVSQSKIKKLFAKYAGKGVAEYFTEMKIKEARRLLEEGKTAYDTGEELGFSSQFYFSAVFKKITGVTPSAYKKNVKM